MAFFVELWESIFTPGPTPTLLRAANLTFLALQLLLALLLAATKSIHFVVLSALCAALWRAVNWFAAELAAAQAADPSSSSTSASTTAQTSTASGNTTTSAPAAASKSSLAEDSDTEVEGDGGHGHGSGAQTRGEARRRVAGTIAGDGNGDEGLRVRGTREARSSASTEDEWERVSESEERL